MQKNHINIFDVFFLDLFVESNIICIFVLSVRDKPTH